MRDFVKMLRLNQSYASYYSSEAEWAQGVATSMEDNEISRQRLEEDFGVVISDEAVDAKLRELLGMTDNSTEEEFDEAYKQLLDILEDSYGFSVKDLKKLDIEPSLVQRRTAETDRRPGLPGDGQSRACPGPGAACYRGG